MKNLSTFYLKALIQAKQTFNKQKWVVSRRLALIKSTDDLAKSKSNALLIGVQHELAEAQFYPFYHYKADLEKSLGIVFSEIPTDEWEKSSVSGVNPKIELVFFQCFFESSRENLTRNLLKIRSSFPNAKIVFMDWFAPLDIRYSEGVESMIDVYIKKQVYRNLEDFINPKQVDTNLSLFYSEKYGIVETQPTRFIDSSILKKVRLGSNFGLSAKIVPLFLRAGFSESTRPVDLHARMAVNGLEWYKNMRQEAFDAVSELPESISKIRFGRVSNPHFLAELHSSKLCFSPFGYGEVCWRDYEAIACGSLLIKPDVSHLRVSPDIFEPFVTYIPVKWDFSDLRKLVEHYLINADERSTVARASFDRMRDWVVGAEFVAEVRGWLN